MNKNLFLKFAHQKDGSIAILAAVMSVALVGAAGVGVDTYNSQSTDTALKHIVDLTCDRLNNADIAIFPTAGSASKMAQGFADNLKVGTAAKDADVIVTQPADPNALSGDVTVSASAAFSPTFTAVIGAQPFKMNKTAVCKRSTVIPNKGSKDPKCNIALTFLDLTRRNSVAVDDLASYAVHEDVGGGTLNYVYSIVDKNNNITTRKMFSQDLVIDPSDLQNGGQDQIMYIQVLNKDGSLPRLEKQCINYNSTTEPPKTNPTPPFNPSDPPPFSSACKPLDPNKDVYSLIQDADEMAGVTKNNGDWEISDLSNYTISPSMNDVIPGVTSVIIVSSKTTGETISVPLTKNFYKLNPSDPKVIKATSTLGTDPETAFLKSMLARAKNNSYVAYNQRARIDRLDKGYKLDHIVSGARASWQAPDDTLGYCPTSQSPIIIDLLSKGHIQTTGVSTAKKAVRYSLGKTVKFDIFGNNSPILMEWLSENGQGFLVDNRDGKAAEDMNGKRLFGNDDKYENGFYKLAATFKADGNGLIYGDNLTGLAVWVDNGDGVVQSGEIKSLSELGITAISTRMANVKDAKGDTLMRSYVIRNDAHVMSEDVWFGLAQ